MAGVAAPSGTQGVATRVLTEAATACGSVSVLQSMRGAPPCPKRPSAAECGQKRLMRREARGRPRRE